jgi:hypothetical protein
LLERITLIKWSFLRKKTCLLLGEAQVPHHPAVVMMMTMMDMAVEATPMAETAEVAVEALVIMEDVKLLCGILVFI